MALFSPSPSPERAGQEQFALAPRWRALLKLISLGLLGFALAAYGSSHPELGFLGLGLAFTYLWQLRSRVTFEGGELNLSGRVLRAADYAEFDIVPHSQPKTILLYDSTGKRLRTILWFWEGEAFLEQWLSERIRRKRPAVLVSAPPVNADVPLGLKVAAWTLNLLSLAILLGGLVLLRRMGDLEFEWAKLVLLVVPPLSLFLVYRSHGRVKLFPTPASSISVPHVKHALYLTSLSICILAFNSFDPLTPMAMLPSVLALAILFFFGAWRADSPPAKATLPALGFYSLLFGAAVTTQINICFDLKEPAKVKTFVLKKYSATHPLTGPSYHVVVAPWGEESQPVDIKVNPTHYRWAAEKQQIYVSVCHGGLDIPWVCGTLLGLSHHQAQRSARHYQQSKVLQQTQSHPNTLALGKQARAAGEISIAIAAPFEMDFQTREQVYADRKKRVGAHPELLLKDYEPASSVFGAIEDGFPWWGLHGIYFFGNGEPSIQGPAEESRYIGNPFLLVGLKEPHAWITPFTPGSDQTYFAYPVDLKWAPRKSEIRIKYEVNGYLRHLERVGADKASRRVLEWCAYNARDFGFNYLSPVGSATTGLVLGKSADTVMEIRQFIHRGGSCGYPGGCNNMSPAQPEFEFFVESLPAKTHLKLWKTAPASASQAADLDVYIEMP